MARFRTSRPNEPTMPDPLGYLLTWTTYGTWLPGDERGWVKHGRGFQFPNTIRELEAAASMTEDACMLDDEQRSLVEATIAVHCDIRQWKLWAVNCRTNHVHVVVSANLLPEKVRDQFKAWCTRKLCEQALGQNDRPRREKWWTERGSQRYLDDLDGLEAAIRYVRDGQ